MSLDDSELELQKVIVENLKKVHQIVHGLLNISKQHDERIRELEKGQAPQLTSGLER